MGSNSNTRINSYTDWIIRWRWLVLGLSVLSVLFLASGARYLQQGGTYKVFFGKDNPQLLAQEALETVYTKGDSQIFIVHNPSGSIFIPTAVEAIRELTEAGWQIPYSTRVDSLVNYQHSWAEGDDLIVEDLIPKGRALDEALLERARKVVRAEPSLRGRLVSLDEDTTLVAVRVNTPSGEGAQSNDAVAADSRELLAKVRQKYPNLHFEITGVSLLQTAFNHAPELDAPVIWPSMLILLVVLMFVLTRSLTGTVATLGVIILSAAAGVGAIGYYGYDVEPVVTVAPMIILTLAIADSVHILSTVFQQIRAGADKNTALRKSMEINLQPIFLTSLTTAVGFLVMNFSDSPPFHHLGNVTATGVGVAWLLSMTFLPAALSVLPLRVSHAPSAGERFVDAVSKLVISNPRKLALGTSILFVFLIASIPRIVINDFPHRYFDETSDFRRGTEFLENQLGFFDFDMSVLATGPGGISDPEYLEALDRFETWLRSQPNVVHVASFVQIIKKLNMNLHADDPKWYRIPENRELAAQYLLLYEMSLPFGLDLNDMINIDKSATKVNVLFQNAGQNEIKRVGLDAQAWLGRNTTHAIATPAAGYSVMFAYIAEDNLISMFWGTMIAFIIIGSILVFSLRSWVVGLASLVSNLLPVAAAIGIWALTVREANFAVSVIASLSIGIVVDDTVHFLSKYAMARRKLGCDAAEAVAYAFTNVGVALLRTSIIIVGGFSVLVLSSFWPTVVIGGLTSLTILCALVADFLLLPSLLIVFDKSKTILSEPPPEPGQG